MKNIIFTLFLLLVSLSSYPQNLVQNNSFENSMPYDFNKWFSNAPYETEFLLPTNPNSSIYPFTGAALQH